MRRLKSMAEPTGLLLAAALSCACSDLRTVRDTPETARYFTDDVYIPRPVQVDVLLVVDDSASMADEQQLMAGAIPDLVRNLLAPAGGNYHFRPVQDVHLGVIGTDMGVGGRDIPTCRDNPLSGDDGLLVFATGRPGCSVAYPDHLSHYQDVWEEPDPELVDRIAGDFGCMAVLGADGCGFEQPLEAALRALTVHMADGGRNTGFLRDSAVLFVLFITDEDDCSVADPSIFDGEGMTGDDSLRCRTQSSKLHSIERYVRGFVDLRGGTDEDEIPFNLLFGFVVGVPPGPECEGRGDEIPTCLDHPSMQEEENPFEGEGSCPATATPARRLVELAQELGDHAAVQSLCGESFMPAAGALTTSLRAVINEVSFFRYYPILKDPLDPCRCEASCSIVEELATGRSCPPEKPPVDGDGDTVGDVSLDVYSGLRHDLCTIPQAGSILDDCTLDCDDPGATHTKDPGRRGWWLDPYGPSSCDWDGDSIDDCGPFLYFGDLRPESGSGAWITCKEVVCPAMRTCGAFPASDRTCCDENEYCWRHDPSGSAPGFCLLRKDVCEEYGADLWCEGAAPPEVEAMAGGLCCLDPDMDGKLDRRLEDLDGDGAGDCPVATLFRCEEGRCVAR